MFQEYVMEYLNKQTDMFLDLKSKTYCECGWINQDLNLSIREWTCKNGHVLDRDLNAAKNILREGLKILNSAGTVENTGGAINKTSAKKHKAVKPEAHPIAFGVGG
jgi:putative transposase